VNWNLLLREQLVLKFFYFEKKEKRNEKKKERKEKNLDEMDAFLMLRKKLKQNSNYSFG